MEWLIEVGRPEDSFEAARLIAETDRHLFDYCASGCPEAWMELAACEWRSARGVYSFEMSRVVRTASGLLGLLIGYSGSRGREIDWSFGSSRPHMDPARLDQIIGRYRLASFLFPAIPDDAYYVQNVVTHTAVRGRGRGRRLMECAFDLGRAEGCKTCHLDVNSASDAVRFYESLGMERLVITEVPAIPGVSAHYRMVKSL